MWMKARALPFVMFLSSCLFGALSPVLSQAQQPAAEKNAQLQSTPAANASSPEASKYVGSETCKTCHVDQYKQIEATQHWNTNLANLKKGTGQEWHGCESWHGPGSAHVDGGGDKSKIFSFKGATAQQVSARCQTCHSTTHPDFQRSVHYQADVSCITCHHRPNPVDASGFRQRCANAPIVIQRRARRENFPESRLPATT